MINPFTKPTLMWTCDNCNKQHLSFFEDVIEVDASSCSCCGTSVTLNVTCPDCMHKQKLDR